MEVRTRRYRLVISLQRINDWFQVTRHAGCRATRYPIKMANQVPIKFEIGKRNRETHLYLQLQIERLFTEI